jgi:alpha-glucosidase (family GH31 glycosyl hydrolase)
MARQPLSKILYLGLVPLTGLAWVAEDLASTYLGEFILTDQRICVRGSPYAWSQSNTKLEDIASMIWRRDTIFIRKKSVRRLQVHVFSEGKQIVRTYEQLTGKNK